MSDDTSLPSPGATPESGLNPVSASTPPVPSCLLDDCGHKVTKHNQFGCRESQCGCSIPYQRHKWTDTGNAYAFLDHFRSRLRYLGGSEWAVYEAGVWTFHGKDGPGPYAVELLSRLRTFEALLYDDTHEVNKAGIPLPSERDYFLDYVDQLEDSRTMSAMITQAMRLGSFRITRRDFDSNHPGMLCVAGGMLRLPLNGKPAKLHPPDPKYFATKQTRAKWDPNATCPHFTRVLKDQFRDPGELDYTLRLLAKACLVQGNLMKTLVLLLGEKDTGKSRIVQALLHAFGSYARPFERSLFTDRNATEKPRSDMIAAQGRRFLASTEIDDVKLNADAVKRLTGGDSTVARDMYKSHSDDGVSVPTWVVLLGVNNMPDISGFDPATKRRLRVVLFSHPVPLNEQDENMAEHLEQEADGILALLVAHLPGADAVLAHVPLRFQVALETVSTDMSPVSQFLHDMTFEEDDHREAMPTIGHCWQAWCDAEQVTGRDRLDNTRLAKQLTRLGWKSGDHRERHPDLVTPGHVRIGRALTDEALRMASAHRWQSNL